MTEAEVAEAIAAMRPGTAASPDDGVQPAALANGGRELHLALALLFSRVLETGDVPTAWTVGYVRWLHKSGSQLDWLNFRGIVLTSTLGKTFERVMLARLSAWSRNVGAITHLQAGSNAPLGVLHQVHLVHGAAKQRAALGSSTFVLLIDITRAFPSTSRAFVYAATMRSSAPEPRTRATEIVYSWRTTQRTTTTCLSPTQTKRLRAAVTAATTGVRRQARR